MIRKSEYIVPQIGVVLLTDHVMLVGASDKNKDGNTQETIGTDDDTGGGDEGSTVFGDAKRWTWDDDLLSP